MSKPYVYRNYSTGRFNCSICNDTYTIYSNAMEHFKTAHPLNSNQSERVGPMINETISHEQEEHLALLKRDFCTLVDTKYRKGCIEHKTLLTDLSIEKLIDEGIAEAIDQFNYLHTLRANYKKLQSLLK